MKHFPLRTYATNDRVLRYVQNTSWLFSDKLVTVVVSTLVGVIVARYLRPMNFGSLSFAMSFSALFSALSVLGLDNILIKRIVLRPTETPAILGTAFGLKAAGGIIGIGLIQAIALKLFPTPETRLLLLVLSVAQSLSCLDVIDFFFQSQVAVKYASLAKSVALIIGTICRLLLIALQAPLLAFGVVILLEAIVTAAIYWFFYQKHWKNLPAWNFSWSLAKQLMRDAWPLIVTGIMVSIYMKIDQVFIKSLLSSESVGYYAVAVKLSESWYFIPMAIVGSVFPSLVGTKKNGEKYFRRFSQLSFLLFWLSVPIMVGVSLLARPIILLLYGAEYLPAAAALSVHVFSAVFVFLGIASANWLLIENLQHYTMISAGLGAIANVALNLLLLPKLGIVGGAYATLLAYAISGYFGLLLFPKTRACFVMQTKALFNFRIIKEF